MNKLYIYNTLSRKKEEFKPINPPEVKMYVCGITPYGDTHLGHARCYVVFDMIKRYLKYSAYNVKYIQNITDIDDKIISLTKKTGDSPKEISDKYFKSFRNLMKELNVIEPDNYPSVSDSMDDIIKFIKDLINNDMAYEKNDSVYFRVSKLEGYGSFSGRNTDEMINKESLSDDKEDIRDFALWKRDEEFCWKSPWGKGRPGWHIECSSISKKYFGDEFDIHGGGLDLVFPHHENEIAQSKALTGKVPARYWIHNGMVTINGEKLAKSSKKIENFFLLKDILKEFSPMVVRMYLLGCSYRQPLNFSERVLKETEKAYNKIVQFKKEVFSKKINCPKETKTDNIISALNDDFNTARAIGEIFKKTTPIMEKFLSGKYSENDICEGIRIINIFENVLGISININKSGNEKIIEELIQKREQYRQNRDYIEADKVRDELYKMGIKITDTPSGARWWKERTLA